MLKGITIQEFYRHTSSPNERRKALTVCSDDIAVVSPLTFEGGFIDVKDKIRIIWKKRQAVTTMTASKSCHLGDVAGGDYRWVLCETLCLADRKDLGRDLYACTVKRVSEQYAEIMCSKLENIEYRITKRSKLRKIVGNE